MAAKSLLPVLVIGGVGLGAAGIAFAVTRSQKPAEPNPEPPKALPPAPPAPEKPAPEPAPEPTPTPPRIRAPTPPPVPTPEQEALYTVPQPPTPAEKTGVLNNLVAAAPLILVGAELWQSYRDNRNPPRGPRTNAQLPPEGSVFKGDDSARVYVMANGTKQWITSEAEFLRRGYTYPIQVLPAAVVNRIPNGPDLGVPWPAKPPSILYEGQFIASPAFPAIWHIQGGQRHHILSMTTLNRYGGLAIVNQNVDQAEIDSITLGADEP